MKKIAYALALLTLLFIVGINAAAQEVIKVATNNAKPNQHTINSLSALPEADTLIYLNVQRILNEALPKFMPEKDLADMRKGFEDVKQNVGIDPAKVEYLVIATRFRKPAADLSFTAPEFILVSGGDFSSESLMTLARTAASGKLRDEQYGGKTIGLMTIDPLVKEAEKNPILKSYTEMGIVPLSENSIAIGSPSYLRAAIDAGAGNGRISSESLNSLLRDPTALISAAGSPWTSFSKTFGLRGTEANARAPRCDSQLGDFYVALNMDTTNFLVRGWMNADNPDTAKIINNLIGGLMRQASTIPDKNAQAALNAVKFAAEDSEVVLRADIPQQVLSDFIKEQIEAKQKKAEVSVAAPATPVKKKTVVRRRRKPAGQ